MSTRGAILGLGRRGEVLAEHCLAAGWDVRAFDPAQSAAAVEVRLPGLCRVSTISSAVLRADWILCCLPERLELIQMVIQRAQSEAPEGAILAVASAAFDIDALQSCAIRPGQVLRLTFADDGGCALDVTQRNSDDVRRKAESAFTSIAAFASVANEIDADGQEFGAESA